MTFRPKISPKILKIFVNLYQLQYCVAMIQICIFPYCNGQDIGDYDVIEPGKLIQYMLLPLIVLCTKARYVPSQLLGSFGRHGRRHGYLCLDTRRSQLRRPPSCKRSAGTERPDRGGCLGTRLGTRTIDPVVLVK